MSSRTSSSLLPAPVIETHGRFLVLRDDLIDGGTKRRALGQMLLSMKFNEFVYPATAYGQGQLALAYAGRDAGKKVTLFMAERTDFSKTPLVTEAMEKAGAEYRFVKFPNFLNVVTARAKAYAETSRNAICLPLGFAMPEFSAALTAVAQNLSIDPPREVWLVGGTGTLLRSLRAAWPKAQINAVTLGMKNGDMTGADRVFTAPEKFEQKAKNPPPFPSAPHYDAKVWQFAEKHGRKGALIWNVGR